MPAQDRTEDGKGPADVRAAAAANTGGLVADRPKPDPGARDQDGPGTGAEAVSSVDYDSSGAAGGTGQVSGGSDSSG